MRTRRKEEIRRKEKGGRQGEEMRTRMREERCRQGGERRTRRKDVDRVGENEKGRKDAVRE